MKYPHCLVTIYYCIRRALHILKATSLKVNIRKLRGKHIGLASLIVVGVFGAAYICRSRNSPNVVDVIVGSILVGLLLPMMSNLIDDCFEKGIRSILRPLLIVTASLLTVFVALLIRSSNHPQKISEQIPVVYLVDPNTLLLPSTPAQDEESIYYWDTVYIFKYCIEKVPRAREALRSVFEKATMGDDPAYLNQLFRDLTEYLVLYNLSDIPATPDIEKMLYTRQSPHWLAIPNEPIRGKRLILTDIEGPLAENLFFADKPAMFPDKPWEFYVPKKVSMTITRKGSYQSVLTIQRKKFMRIEIGIVFLITQSQGFAFLRDSERGAERDKSGEPYRAYRSFEARIYYSATFNKTRYGYPAMRDYEEWAQDVLSVLKRDFSWGNPPKVGSSEIQRYLKLQEKQSQDKAR
jgi:hypothetical protein